MTRPIAHALVTGGAGIIGSHLVNALLRQGARVPASSSAFAGEVLKFTPAMAFEKGLAQTYAWYGQ